jgi:malonyl-CoA decarboxylase
MMVNYLYDLDRIEINHEEYFDKGEISASKPVTRLLQSR